MSKNELNDPTPPERLPEHLTHKPEADGNVAPARALTDPVCCLLYTSASYSRKPSALIRAQSRLTTAPVSFKSAGA